MRVALLSEQALLSRRALLTNRNKQDQRSLVLDAGGKLEYPEKKASLNWKPNGHAFLHTPI